MKKKALENGLIYYEATAEDTARLGGFGICDDCGSFAQNGYLVPVLNHYMCESCFSDWSARAKHYSEDDIYEKRTSAYYESRIPYTDETEEPEHEHE